MRHVTSPRGPIGIHLWCSIDGYVRDISLLPTSCVNFGMYAFVNYIWIMQCCRDYQLTPIWSYYLHVTMSYYLVHVCGY